ncbi:MAG TPA: non-canonical purine NTP pyrophosphatase, partial [Actinomycetes bacterium]|nr:non-canonical purine NTP pyrophosphatase [Actinomycetes bacterium]
MTRRGPARLLLATANQGKLRELRTILDGLPVELVGLAEAGLGEPPEVEETGDTFLENALLKGRAYAAWSGLAAVADDSGLEVDALGGRPGVRSARFAKEGATDAENNAALLAALEHVEDEQRQARFRCVMVLVDPWSEGDGDARSPSSAGARPVVTEGRCEGSIGREPKGAG